MRNIQVRRKIISVITLGMLTLQFFPMIALGATDDAESTKFSLTRLCKQTLTKPYSFVKNFVDDEIERQKAASIYEYTRIAGNT